MSNKVVGQSVPRIDAATKVRGQRKFPQDFNMKGQLYAKVVWSEYPHARVLKIDLSLAEALPGVVAILTSKDVPVNEYGINIIDQPVLVGEGEGVRWLGDRIAIVIAESEKIAQEARQLVKGLIYPVPDPAFPFLGVHFTRTIHGEVEAGPNAVLAFAREGYAMRKVNLRETMETLSYRGFWRMASRYWKTGLQEVYRSLSKQAFVRSLQKLLPD
ncbi:MAG: hypothetical protein Q8O76_15285, partial [Chloroflexota bacterium]|nr:hypothetical protein [Chloroflexota bacterium]